MLGFHVMKEPKIPMAECIDRQVKTMRSKRIDIRSVQIFVMGPKTFTANINDVEAADIRRTCEALGITLIVHGSYVNHPFGENEAKGIHFINEELRLASLCGARGVVIHLPRRPVARIVEVYSKIRRIPECVLYLEIESMKASPDTYETSEKIRGLFTELMKIDPECGLCVDSAHKWSSGFDNRTYAAVQQWCAEVDAIGIRNVMMHLSDSNRAFASGMDNHASVTHGNIWREYRAAIAASGLQAYLEWIIRKNMMCILERNQDDLHHDFDVLRHLFPPVP